MITGLASVASVAGYLRQATRPSAALIESWRRAVCGPSPAAPAPALAPTPPPSPPASTPAPAVAVASLVAAAPPLAPPSRRPVANPYLDDALDTLARDARATPDSYDAIVPAAMAVAADPASVPARFVEACMLAKHGLHDLARRVLDTLRTAPRCPACSDALVEARRDACGLDATTRAAIAAARPSATRTAAEAVLASLNSGDVGSIARYLDAGAVTITSACSVCTEPMSTTERRSAAAFRAFVRAATRRLEDGPYTHHRPVFLLCDDRCCSGPTGMLSHTAIFVTSVCFRGSRDAPKLASIGVIDGG